MNPTAEQAADRITVLERDVQVARGQYQSACDIIRELERQREELFFSLLHALDWIDAVPKDTNLPDMPGFNREYVDDLLAKVKGEK